MQKLHPTSSQFEVPSLAQKWHQYKVLTLNLVLSCLFVIKENMAMVENFIKNGGYHK